MGDNEEKETPGRNVVPPIADDADRSFDIDPTEATEAPAAPGDDAADAAVEAAAQAVALRARQRILSERAARESLAPPPAAPDTGAQPTEQPPAPFAPKPGKQRWPVKTLNDADTQMISFEEADVVETTVEEMWLLERPADMPLTKAVPAYQSNRAEGAETTVWRIRGHINAHKWEKDGDLHLILQDLESGYTMVVESPQNGKGSDGKLFVGKECPPEARDRIVAARKQFEQELDPKPYFKNTHRLVTLTGVGFFDVLHGASGAAQTNSIELHPVLDVIFED